MDETYFAVHKNTDLAVYARAQRGELYLFYSTKPMAVNYDASPAEFAGEYAVLPSQALTLRELILKNTPPESIVSQLGLKKTSLGLEDCVSQRGYSEDTRLKLPRRMLIPGGPGGGFREVFKR